MDYRTRAVSLFISTTLLALPSLALAAFDTNLSVGARGSAVTELQQFLIARGHLAAGNATGYFGPLTLSAVKAFQSSQGVQPVSGFFGPLTRAKAVSVSGGGGAQNGTNAAAITALLDRVRQLQAQITTLQTGPSATSPTSIGNKTCHFNGATIASSANVTAYERTTVPHGQTCRSQTRTCNDGNLSGSYLYGSCTVSAILYQESPQQTPVPTAPATPTGLTYSCNEDGTKATLSWNASAGANFYLLRVNNAANDTASCQDGWYCPNTDDVRADNGVNGNSYTAPVVPGRSYLWWLLAGNTAGASGTVGGPELECSAQ